MATRTYAVEVSTEVFHLLQDRTPGFIAWLEEKPGPAQKILLEEDVYVEFIDRAIAHRQTLDQLFRALCMDSPETLVLGPAQTKHARRTEDAS